MPKLLDFGIAKWLHSTGTKLTGTGMTLGTPNYMSPEQGLGRSDVDHRADIWSLGVVLYECLSGVRPIEGGNLGQFIEKLGSAAIIPLGELEPELPTPLGDLVMRMLARPRQERPSMAEVVDVVNRYQQPAPVASTAIVPLPPARQTRWRWIIAIVILVAIAGGAGAWMWSRTPAETTSSPPAPETAEDPPDTLVGPRPRDPRKRLRPKHKRWRKGGRPKGRRRPFR